MLLQTPDEGLTYIIPGENKTLTQQELFDRFGEPLSVVSVSDEVAATVQDKAKRVGQYQDLLEQYQKGDYTPFKGKAGESTPKTSGISALQQSQQQGSDFAEYAGGESRPLNVTDEEFNREVVGGSFTYTDGEGRQKSFERGRCVFRRFRTGSKHSIRITKRVWFLQKIFPQKPRNAKHSVNI